MASATTMHLVMSTEKMSSHCLEMAKPTASHSLHETDYHQDQNLVQPDCVSDGTQQSSDCLDCGTMACQNLVTSLPIATPELSVPDYGYPEKTLLPAYHAKHLAGYWQEILRPPKA